MHCFGYVRGNDPAVSDAIRSYAARNGFELLDVFTDREDGYSGLRQLINLLKLGASKGVIVPSEDHFGGDEYFRTDLELLFRRMGVKLFTLKLSLKDCRHDIMEAIGRYVSPDPEWGSRYGACVPVFPEYLLYRSDPLYGLVRDGAGSLVPDAEAAVNVRDIFDRYAAGESIASICDRINARMLGSDTRFGTISIRIMLDNELYLGGISEKGERIPPVISLRQWFPVRERLEREFGTEKTLIPFCEGLYSDGPISFMSRSVNAAGFMRRGDNNVDTRALEAAVCKAVREFASPENARRFHSEFAVPGKQKADGAFPYAAVDHNMNVVRFRNCLDRLVSGDISRGAQEKLEKAADQRMVSAWRLRRIRSERELFSVSLEETEHFFERASRMETLPREERRFMADAFIRAIRLKDGRASAFLRDPVSGTIKQRILEGVLVPDSEIDMKR